MNHLPGSPASMTAASTPLRLMKVTRLEPRIPSVDASAARQAAIVSVRAKWPFGDVICAVGRTDCGACSAIAGSTSRISSIVAAWCRMWQSSPIATACAHSPNTSMGPRAASAASKPGATSSANTRWRRIASALPTPSQNASPGPSQNGDHASTPLSSSRTTHTAIDGEMTPVIAPGGPERVAGGDLDIAAREPGLGVGGIGRPSLEQARADDRVALRRAHALPRDRRARVQHEPAVETRDVVDGQAGAHEHRAGRLKPRHGELVRGLHVVARQGGEQADVGGVARRRGAPVDRLDRDVLRPQGLRHEVQARCGDA